MDTSTALQNLTVDPDEVEQVISNMNWNTVVNVLLVLGIGSAVSFVIMKLLRRAMKKLPLDQALMGFIYTCIRVLLIIIVLTMATDKLGVSTSSFVAILSLFMLAISLSVQSVLSNVVGGIVILTSKPFLTGDYIETSTAAGSIQEINLMHTRLMTYDNKQVLIPNSKLMADQIINYTKPDIRRVDVSVRVGYEYDNNRVLAVLLRTAEHTPGVLTDIEGKEPASVVNAYGDGGIEYALRCWVKNADYWPVRNAMMNSMRYELAKDGIELTSSVTHTVLRSHQGGSDD